MTPEVFAGQGRQGFIAREDLFAGNTLFQEGISGFVLPDLPAADQAVELCNDQEVGTPVIGHGEPLPLQGHGQLFTCRMPVP